MLPKRFNTRHGSHRTPMRPSWRPTLRSAATQQPRKTRRVQVSAVGDFFRSMFDFESWAPKSTRIWRLQQYKPPGSGEGPTASQPDRNSLNQLRPSNTPPSSSGTSSSYSSSSGISPSGSSSGSYSDAVKSFSDADDDEVSAALGQRIKQIASATGDWGSSSSVSEAEMRQPLTGEEIRKLLLTKYGKSYDLSFVRRDVPGMKTFVCLNIMWLHLEQRSFRMTYDQYMEKLDGVAALVNVLGQTNKVRAFLTSPARSQKGLPRRPVVGTAVSIRFDLHQAVIDEWFGQGYN